MSKGAALTLDAGICLRCSKLYNNNLSSWRWLASSLAPACLLLSAECLRYGAGVVYISGCSEGKTNGILHKYPSSSTLRGSLRYLWPAAHFPQLPTTCYRLSFLALPSRLPSVRLFLFRNQPNPKGRHLSPRMFRLRERRKRGGKRNGTAFER